MAREGEEGERMVRTGGGGGRKVRRVQLHILICCQE